MNAQPVTPNRASDPSKSAAAPGAALRLRHADVDIWRVALDAHSDAAVSRLRRLLSTDEDDRAQRYVFERDRRRFIVGRGVLRMLLGGYLGCPAADISFQYERNGKPELGYPADESFHFNLAHSEGLAVYAFTRTGEVGIDIEGIRDLPDVHAIAACLPEEEQRRVESAPGEERLLELFRAWTRQEALLKATGVGLGGAGTDEADAAGTGRTGGAPTDGMGPLLARPSRRFRLLPLDVDPGFAGALAVSRSARWVTCLDWDFVHGTERVAIAHKTQRFRFDQLTPARIAFP